MSNVQLLHSYFMKNVSQTYSEQVIQAQERYQDIAGRNTTTRCGDIVLQTSGLYALAVGLVAAPRTTLGLAAAGSGLLAAGNADRLKDWAARRRASRPVEAAATAETA